MDAYGETSLLNNKFMQTGQHITLFDLNQTIRTKLVEAFPESLWVIAEISEIKVGTTGHCYLDLIQKE